MRSSAQMIFFTIIQDFCTDRAAREDATKISMCDFDNSLMPSLLVGGLQDHGVWICPQPVLLQQHREVLVAGTGCFWEVRSPFWNKIAYFFPHAEIITNSQKAREQTHLTEISFIPVAKFHNGILNGGRNKKSMKENKVAISATLFWQITLFRF